ncbi:MAPEG family protein [Erwinia sp. S43]|mgnify:CR=1 FL=1|uniref:MAPEG family protein n=1 Tax=Erwiniaceae TaxID=1903409 RepID=UPI00190AF012|nr:MULTISPECIES: MAPEG family protein [Erwiniaceae]MBK0031689.1 MAPEG family protein [Erwinia sp. S43]MBM7341025.1 putative membrane protein YecN with MAPEG domain [Pantoea coffeiphila]MCW1877677.1 MAPEG family protein [Erwinia sp. INIA01]
MVSALYVVFGALLIIKFSLDVVRLRRQYRISIGDGGVSDLQLAIRIHGNAVEYIPLATLLLVVMEMNGADIWLIHLLGLFFFFGRLLHAWGLRSRTMLWRRNGMILTLLTLLGMIIVNLIFLPWDLVLTLH